MRGQVRHGQVLLVGLGVGGLRPVHHFEALPDGGLEPVLHSVQ